MATTQEVSKNGNGNGKTSAATTASASKASSYGAASKRILGVFKIRPRSWRTIKTVAEEAKTTTSNVKRVISKRRLRLESRDVAERKGPGRPAKEYRLSGASGDK